MSLRSIKPVKRDGSRWLSGRASASDREVVGSNPGRTIPKASKMVPVATLLGVQH